MYVYLIEMCCWMCVLMCPNTILTSASLNFRKCFRSLKAWHPNKLDNSLWVCFVSIVEGMSFGGGDLLLNKWRQDSRGWKVRPYPITMWKMLAIHAPNNWVKGASVFHLFNNQQTAIYWILKMYLVLTGGFSSSCRFKVNMSEVQDDRLLSIKLCYPWCLLFILGNLTHLWWRFLISERAGQWFPAIYG